VTFDSVRFRHPCDGGRDTNIHTPDITFAPTGGGNTELGWNLNNDLKIHGLRGLLGPTPLNDSNTICIQVYLTMSCGYANEPVLFYTKGISTCSIVDSTATSITPMVNSHCCTPTCWVNDTFDITFNNDSARSHPIAYYQCQRILIIGKYTVDTNVTFDNCSIAFAPNAMVSVTNNSLLSITSNGIGYYCNTVPHLYSACDTMWRGIFVNPGSEVDISKAALIEDADTAIVSMNTSLKQGLYKLETVNFNKNYKDIVVEPCPNKFKGKSEGCIYTCRNLSLLTSYPWVTYFGSTSLASMYYPHIGQRTLMGWQVDSVSHFSDGGDYSGIGYDTTGGSNVFDNLHYGVYSYNSNTFIYGDTLENIINAANDSAAITAMGGTIGDTLIVGGHTVLNNPNIFKNCTTGVFADANFSKVSVVDNHFSDSLTTPTIGVLTNGDMQFLSSIVIDSNYIHGANVGVQCVLNRFTRTTQIDSNVITGRSACDSATGIYISEIGSRSAFYNVYNNTINYLHYGIYVNGVRADTIYKNSILLTGDTGCVNPVAKGIAIIGGSNAQVVDNTVSMTNYTNPSDFLGTDFKGIYVENSPSCHMTCNIINYVDTAIDCSGAGDLSPFEVLYNTMNAGNNSNAVGIDLPNGSIIGFQGTPGSASDNVWNGTFACNSNVPFPTNASASQFFVQSASGYNPDLGLSCTIDIVTNSASPGSTDCSSVPPIHFDLLDTIARRKISYEEYVDTTNIIAKAALTSILWSNPSLLSEDTILNNFNDSISTTSLGDIMRADSAMINSNSTLVGTAYPGYFTTLTPASNIEAHLQTVGKIVLNARSTGATTLTSTELSALETLANKCPYTDGIGVYQARTLLDYYTGKVTLYNDESCGSHSGHRPVKHNETAQKSDTISNVSANIYPNPNNGNFTLAYSLGNQTSGRMELYSQIGVKISEYLLTSPMGIKEISASNLNSGLYIYKVYAGDTIIKIGKIVIMK